ncbi:putative ribonuclease H [Rosa chinensis]|uniref:Putative ribonuclease H n=1 Tax=Rosa chinensis TaxID=74649 RepID=A0A2P6R444_ROSCH|nr:putative ribonuclease H [Rosa chinensis]
MNFSSHVSYTTGRTFATTSSPSSSWRTKPNLSAGIKSNKVDFALTRVHVQLRSNGSSSRRRKTTSCCARTNAMEVEKEAFYLVRKGDIVGVYRNFGDCEAQIGSSICDPPVSVYKGYSLPKDTEEHLVSFGLTNAIYTIRAEDLKQDHFGKLMLCPFHEPAASECEESVTDTSVNGSDEVPGSEYVGFCTLEFDGASKGNPGLAGAGAVLRADDGSLICKVHEGLGIKTNNVAEYRALILGLRCALKKGFTKIRVQGDSKLVCMQVQGLWKVKNQNLSDLCEEVKELKEKFVSFEISHVLRDKNSEADAQANLAVRLSDGEVHEVI